VPQNVLIHRCEKRRDRARLCGNAHSAHHDRSDRLIVIAEIGIVIVRPSTSSTPSGTVQNPTPPAGASWIVGVSESASGSLEKTSVGSIAPCLVDEDEAREVVVKLNEVSSAPALALSLCGS
jgi:hypothetical protein